MAFCYRRRYLLILNWVTKMKKAFSIFTAFALLFCISGCVDNTAKNYDANAAADALNAALTFGESLEKSTAEAAYSIYGIDSALCSNAAIYVGSGATADEIAVFNCIDTESAKTVLEAVNSRKAYLEEGYSSYGPDQVPKIKSAVIISSAETVILCICENPDAVGNILETLNNN